MEERPDLGNVMAMISFAAVVSTGGFSNAANLLGYSKAAVSRQIAKLEQSIGVRLLERTTRSVSLTPAGREMYARCARIVDEVNEANQIITGMVSKPRGDLKVNAPVVSSLFDLTAIIPRFLQTYPDVRLFLNLSDSHVGMLKGRFDVAFWMGDPPDSSFEYVLLRDYPMALIAAPAYLAKTGEAGQKALETVWKQTRPEMSTGPMMAKLASGEYKVLYFGSGVVVFPKINDAVNKKVMGWNFIEDGTPFFLRLMAIPKGAPNPNSARLLLDFILSHTGQAAFGRGGLTPYRPGVKKEEVAFYTYESIREELGEENLSFIDYDPAMVKKIPGLVERWKQVTQSK